MVNSKVSIIINQKFLYSLRPENVVKIGIIFFFITLIIAPVELVGNISLKAFSYIALCLVGFFIGCKCVRANNKNVPKRISFEINKGQLSRIYSLSLIFAIFGVFTKFIDVFLIRGVSWNLSTVENQEAIAEGGGNPISIISAILIFFTYIPVSIDCLAKHLHKKNVKILSFLIFASNLLDCLSTGSRFALIRPLVYFTLLICLTRSLENISRKKIVIIVFTSFFILGNLVGSMFLKRLQDMNLDELVSVAAETGGYAKNVPVSKNYQDIMDATKDKWFYPYIFTYVNVTQYITHAVFEFPDVMDFVDKKDRHFFGQSTFFVYSKFINKLTGKTNDVKTEIEEYNLRPGIWSTFFFSWYLDFGWFGIFLFMLTGVFAKKLWARAFLDHNIYYIPITLFLTIIWALLLQLNYIQGSGTYAITIFLLVALFCHQGRISDLQKHYQSSLKLHK